MIELTLAAQPLRLAMSERKDFKISITATNRGLVVIDPELHLAKLFVNGQESMAWILAIGNGKREAKWFALPPGETISMSWEGLGEAFFPSEGEYSLVLSLGDVKAPVVRVEIPGY